MYRAVSERMRKAQMDGTVQRDDSMAAAVFKITLINRMVAKHQSGTSATYLRSTLQWATG